MRQDLHYAAIWRCPECRAMRWIPYAATPEGGGERRQNGAAGKTTEGGEAR